MTEQNKGQMYSANSVSLYIVSAFTANVLWKIQNYLQFFLSSSSCFLDVYLSHNIFTINLSTLTITFGEIQLCYQNLNFQNLNELFWCCLLWGLYEFLDLKVLLQRLQGITIPSKWFASMWSLMALSFPSFPHTLHL